nr:hypothetical protein [Tanacetum cinerariifolium]
MQIAIGQRFSLNKSSDVREKPNTPRSYLRWILTGKIFKTDGLRWIPTGNMFTDSTTKVDSEPLSGSNKDITNQMNANNLLINGHMTLGYISSGLVQNLISLTPYVPPSKKDYEILFQQLFYEYLNPLPHVVSPVLAVVATLRAIDPAGLLSSTTIDQDVPSASSSPTTQEIQYQVTHQGVEEQIHRHQNAQFDNAPFLHNLFLDPSSKETTLQGFIPSNFHHLNQSFNTLTKLTMNHPLENVISDPS